MTRDRSLSHLSPLEEIYSPNKKFKLDQGKTNMENGEAAKPNNRLKNYNKALIRAKNFINSWCISMLEDTQKIETEPSLDIDGLNKISLELVQNLEKFLTKGTSYFEDFKVDVDKCNRKLGKTNIFQNTTVKTEIKHETTESATQAILNNCKQEVDENENQEQTGETIVHNGIDESSPDVATENEITKSLSNNCSESPQVGKNKNRLRLKREGNTEDTLSEGMTSESSSLELEDILNLIRESPKKKKELEEEIAHDVKTSEIMAIKEEIPTLYNYDNIKDLSVGLPSDDSDAESDKTVILDQNLLDINADTKDVEILNESSLQVGPTYGSMSGEVIEVEVEIDPDEDNLNSSKITRDNGESSTQLNDHYDDDISSGSFVFDLNDFVPSSTNEKDEYLNSFSWNFHIAETEQLNLDETVADDNNPTPNEKMNVELPLCTTELQNKLENISFSNSEKTCESRIHESVQICDSIKSEDESEFLKPDDEINTENSLELDGDQNPIATETNNISGNLATVSPVESHIDFEEEDPVETDPNNRSRKLATVSAVESNIDSEEEDPVETDTNNRSRNLATVSPIESHIDSEEEDPFKTDTNNSSRKLATVSAVESNIDSEEDPVATETNNRSGTSATVSPVESDMDSEEEERRKTKKEIRNAMQMLQEDSDMLFSDSSSTSTPSASTSSSEKRIQRRCSVSGKVIYTMPTISTSPKVDQLVDDKWSHLIKPCSVRLARLDLPTITSSLSTANELKQIERLTNLNISKRSRRKSSSSDQLPRKKKLKRKDRSSTNRSSSENESINSADDFIISGSERSQTPILNLPYLQDEKDALAEIIRYNIGSETTDESMKESDEEKDENRKKIKKLKSVVKSPVKTEKSEWKNDPLLRAKLSESETSDDEINEDEILSTKILRKVETAEERRKQRLAVKTFIKTEELHSSDDTDLEKNNKINFQTVPILVDSCSDVDSDIEFVSRTMKTSKCKSICISTSDDSSEECSYNTPKKGRKNIRNILSDETLQEATKKANIEEENRKERLSARRSNLDSLLTQSQPTTEGGMILDMDEENDENLVTVHPRLTDRLKKHQQEGVRFMWDACFESLKQIENDSGSGCILAHCMGLGKTFQVVSLIHTLVVHPKTNTRYILIVCPLSTVLNWQNEFKIGLEELDEITRPNIFGISGSCNQDKRLYIINQWHKKGGVLIMGYEAFLVVSNLDPITNKGINVNKIKEAIIDPGPDLIILDEGHMLKSLKNSRTKALMKVKTKRRIILTGTPLQNNLTEYYYMVQYVKPNLLGNYHEFTNRFVNPITNGQYDDSTEQDIRKMKCRSHILHKILRGTIQRYEVAELQQYLPEKIDYVLFVQLHPVQAELYKIFMDGLRNNNEIRNARLFGHFNQLSLVWGHPYMLVLNEQKLNQKKAKTEVDTINLEPEDKNDNPVVPPEWWKSIDYSDFANNIDYGPKFKIMLSIIEECEEVGDKVLIFSKSLIELDCIEHFLRTIGTKHCKCWESKLHYYRMDGTVSPDTRNQLCNSFNDKNNRKTRVFLMSHKVGGLGLNLVGANRVILMDVSWNPAYDLQSIFRMYRFGQNKRCFVYRLVSMGTMEEVVYERSITKLAIAGRVVDEQQICRHFKCQDISEMYRSRINLDQEKPQPRLPQDKLLANLLQKFDKDIFKYVQHETLLENCPDEELDEEQRKVAWDEFNKENENERKMQAELVRQKSLPSTSGVKPFIRSVVIPVPDGSTNAVNQHVIINGQEEVLADPLHTEIVINSGETKRQDLVKNPYQPFPASQMSFKPKLNPTKFVPNRSVLLKNVRFPKLPPNRATVTSQNNQTFTEGLQYMAKNNQRFSELQKAGITKNHSTMNAMMANNQILPEHRSVKTNKSLQSSTPNVNKAVNRQQMDNLILRQMKQNFANLLEQTTSQFTPENINTAVPKISGCFSLKPQTSASANIPPTSKSYPANMKLINPAGHPIARRPVINVEHEELLKKLSTKTDVTLSQIGPPQNENIVCPRPSVVVQQNPAVSTSPLNLSGSNRIRYVQMIERSRSNVNNGVPNTPVTPAANSNPLPSPSDIIEIED